MNLSFLNIQPGIVVFFASDKKALDKNQPLSGYVNNLRLRTLRHDLEFDIQTPPVPELEGYTVARLFNIGNIQTNSYVYISPAFGTTSQSASLYNFFDKIIDLTDWKRGSIDATEPIVDDFCNGWVAAPDLDSKLCGRPLFSKTCEENSRNDSIPSLSYSRGLKNLTGFEEKEDETKEELELGLEVNNMEELQKEMMTKIAMLTMEYVKKFHEMPPIDKINSYINGKFIIDENLSSPIVVNSNLEIILPNFNEAKIKLTPLCKALYFLFLQHPEGIVLKEIYEHNSTLAQLYAIIKPTATKEKICASIRDLSSPLSDSLIQKISMIKRIVKSVIPNPDIAANFFINGTRGERFSIRGASDCRLPAILDFKNNPVSEFFDDNLNTPPYDEWC